MLGAIAVARTPLTPAELSYILSDARVTVTTDEIQEEVLRHLQSILVIPSTNDTPRDQHPVLFIHASVGDYLTETCQDTRFSIDLGAHHARMAYRCLRNMCRDLRRDICKIGDPTKLNKEVEDLQERLRPLRLGLTYCSFSWAAHLDGSTSSTGKEAIPVQDIRLTRSGGGRKSCREELFDELRVFAESHLLHWFELLSLLSQTNEVIAILSLADAWLLVSYQGVVPV